MKRDTAHTIAFIGVMTALMFVVLTLETFVFIYFIKPSPAFFSIPLFIALSMYGNFRNSFIGGTIFGMCSFLLSFIVGYTVFYNPLISVLPRALAGVFGYLIYRGLSLAFKTGNAGAKDKIVCGVSAGLTVILHTVLVLGAMQIFSAGGAFFDTVWQTIIGVNFISEFVCAVILVPVFVQIIRNVTHVNKKNDGGKAEKNAEDHAEENIQEK